jgi:nucleotide-binding universal stress UspA family protein
VERPDVAEPACCERSRWTTPEEDQMFKRVLVGVDGTPRGRDAIALASRLLDREGALTLAHVRSGPANPPRALMPQVFSEERLASEQLLEQEREQAGVNADTISVAALTPGRGLHERAEDLRADLLVVGSCRHGAFGRVMLGDDTRAALNGAPGAVAIAALGYAEHPAVPARIGVAYNGSAESESALELAIELARASRASVHALEVVPLRTYGYTAFTAPVPVGGEIEDMLAEAQARLGTLAGVEGAARYGMVGEELASFGDEVDLLVVGSRGYGPLRRLVSGSTTMYLERHARCSLLVLPRTPRSEDSRAEHELEERAGASVA